MKTKQTTFIFIYLCFVLLTFPISNSLLKLTDTNSESKANKERKNIIKQNETFKVESIEKIKVPEDKYVKVEIKKSTNFLAKTPTYVKPPDDGDGMKSAILIQTNEYQIPKGGMTERPNFLSTVIKSSPTSVTSSGVRIDANSPTFDLDSISEQFILIS